MVLPENLTVERQRPIPLAMPTPNVPPHGVMSAQGAPGAPASHGAPLAMPSPGGPAHLAMPQPSYGSPSAHAHAVPLSVQSQLQNQMQPPRPPPLALYDGPTLPNTPVTPVAQTYATPGTPGVTGTPGAGTLGTLGTLGTSGTPVSASAVNTGELTVEQFETARRQAATQAHDPRAQLELARRLLEASDALASRYTDPIHPSTMEVDAAQQQRNRDAWNAQAVKIAKHLASKTQFPDALFLLGSIYSSRRYGVDMDYIKALDYYHKAAKLDHAEAGYRIAVCEEFGVGTRRNVEKAVSWYKRAAMQGSPGSMYKLGMLSMLGSLEQPRDFATGLKWLQRAAERADAKNPHALHELALLYEHSPLSTYVPGDPLAQNDAKALELFYNAARLGYSPAQTRLGRAFEFGELGCQVDPQRSIAWYVQAANKGESDAELAMAGWFWTGAPSVLKQSNTEAFIWAERSAQQGNVRAMFAAGHFYELGIGVSPDLGRAKKYYTLAAEKNHARAVQRLRELY